MDVLNDRFVSSRKNLFNVVLCRRHRRHRTALLKMLIRIFLLKEKIRKNVKSRKVEKTGTLFNNEANYVFTYSATNYRKTVFEMNKESHFYNEDNLNCMRNITSTVKLGYNHHGYNEFTTVTKK